MKKRIAVWMPGGVGGGYYSQGIPVISKLIDDLSSDFDITIYSLHPPNAGFTPNGYKLFSPRGAVGSLWLRWLILIFWFAKHSVKKRYQILYAFWGYPAGLVVTGLAKLYRVPSVIHLQGGDAVFIPSIHYGSLSGFKQKVIRWAYNRCTVLIALSEFQKEKLIEWDLKRLIEVIPFGIDPDLFRMKEKFDQHNPTRFLHVGNLTPVKDQQVLLDAFKIISDKIPATLRIIGEDHLKGAIRQYGRHLELESKITFTTIQPYESMPGHYEWADVLLHTSVFEGQCMAIVEGAACGVLLAGTRTGILSDWGEACGIVVEIKDSTSLAKRVLDGLDKQDEIQQCIDQAHAHVKNRIWTFERVKELLDSI